MKYSLFFFIPIFIFSCQSYSKEDKFEWEPLWNGQDLTGWHSFLGTPYNLRTDSSGNDILPFGLDNDPLEVIKMVETNDGKAIRISGIAWGMIYTQEDFKNYHLKLKVK